MKDQKKKKGKKVQKKKVLKSKAPVAPDREKGFIPFCRDYLKTCRSTYKDILNH